MLKNALLSNAIFSALSGVIILSFGSLLGQHIPLPHVVWLVVGTGLLVFALDLVVLVAKPVWAVRYTKLVVWSDIAWVVVTVSCLVLFWGALTETGVLMILGVNLMVGFLAGWQSLALQKEQGKELVI